MNEINYAEVGRAERRAQAIEEAFRAILRANFPAAERCLAQAQQAHYSQTPWLPGAPLKDAVGNSIVYRDFGGGFRYRVALLDEKTNAHVRVLQDGSYAPRLWEAWGKTAEQAQAVAKAYTLEQAHLEPRQTSSQQFGEWVLIRYEMTRPPLD